MFTCLVPGLCNLKQVICQHKVSFLKKLTSALNDVKTNVDFFSQENINFLFTLPLLCSVFHFLFVIRFIYLDVFRCIKLTLLTQWMNEWSNIVLVLFVCNSSISYRFHLGNSIVPLEFPIFRGGASWSIPPFSISPPPFPTLDPKSSRLFLQRPKQTPSDPFCINKDCVMKLRAFIPLC